MENGKGNDDFWDLGDFTGRTRKIAENARQIAGDAQKTAHDALKAADTREIAEQAHRAFPPHRTSAVEISDIHPSDSAKKFDESETVITKFVPPHSSAGFVKKHIICEYEPENPLIKSVTIYSEREGEQLFVSDNLFIRERRALLDREVTFKEYVPFYSYAPRYSQLNKAQLNYYLWWRQNLRNGIFTKTDESYIMLYAYELAATGDGEDKQQALDMLCALLTNFPASQLNLVYKIMIRDIVVDFCLIHRMPSPIGRLQGLERQVLFGSFLPEFFTDLSQAREYSAPVISSMSLYDYKRSKCYNESTAEVFRRGVDGALSSVMNDEEAFSSITSFTRGVYGSVSHERHPFNRMANIVNKNIKIDIVYYPLDNIKSAVTDIVRYSENKIRDHLGIRSKINVLTVNPLARRAIDSFFEEQMPPQKFVDRRRKDARVAEEETHEYDKYYEVPKAEISPERALEIERASWATTQKLTEAFSEENTEDDVVPEPVTAEKQDSASPMPEQQVIVSPAPEAHVPVPSDSSGLYAQLCSRIGSLAEFVNLCKGASLIEQRKFASSKGTTADELADKINETAVELFGDIILEFNGSAYAIIEDYLFLFD